MTRSVGGPILDDVRTAHDIIAMLPDDVHAEVIEGEVIVNAATPAGRHARIVLAVRRAFARRGIDNLFENTTLLVEHDEEEYVPDLARWPEQVIDGDRAVLDLGAVGESSMWEHLEAERGQAAMQIAGVVENPREQLGTFG